MRVAAVVWLVSGIVWASEGRAAGVGDLGWLAGCWAAEGAEAGSEEHWTAPAGGTLFAVSRTVKGGKTVAFEFIRIEEREGGELYFVALPSGQTLTEFRLIESAARKAVFENQEHDFPQRVIYERKDDRHLVGRIEGTKGGKQRGVDFPMVRTACP